MYTVHNPLVFLQRMSNANHRLMRWSLICQSYNLLICHKKGIDNVIADTLSRVNQYNYSVLFLVWGCYDLQSLGTEHRWCEDPIESAPFIIRDRAPMVQRTLLNLLRLLGPKPERRRALVFSLGFYFFFFFFFEYSGIFGGLNMVKNS